MSMTRFITIHYRKGLPYLANCQGACLVKQQHVNLCACQQLLRFCHMQMLPPQAQNGSGSKHCCCRRQQRGRSVQENQKQLTAYEPGSKVILDEGWCDCNEERNLDRGCKEARRCPILYVTASLFIVCALHCTAQHSTAQHSTAHRCFTTGASVAANAWLLAFAATTVKMRCTLVCDGMGNVTMWKLSQTASQNTEPMYEAECTT